MWELMQRQFMKGLDLSPTFIIAEAGVNHNGDIKTAKSLVDVAVNAGADAVKFQTFKADTLLSKNSPKAQYQLETTDKKESQYEMLKKLELSREEFTELYSYCKSRGIMFISTPFDEESVDLLEQLGVDAYKVASSEVTNIPLLKHIAKKGKSVILSTGMSTLAEVAAAVSAIELSNPDIHILHCVSNYPANFEDVNLKCMESMRLSFGHPIGYSDHTKGTEAVMAAVALGATIIEKHFTLDSNMEGPDHRASLNPDELVEMVKGIRRVEKCLGSTKKERMMAEESSCRAMRKSLVAAQDIEEGQVLSRDMLSVKRPGTGLYPEMIDFVVGLKVTKFVGKDEVIKEEHFK